MRSGRPHPPRAAAFLAAGGVLLVSAQTALAGGFQRDRTPLPKDLSSGGTSAVSHSSSSGAFIRMLFGLAIVIGVVFALYWVLKKVGNRNSGSGIRDDGKMTIVASTQLAPTRSLHLVRVGDELVLVGSAEQGVTPIRVYTADEARRLGVDPDALLEAPAPAAFRSNGSRPGGSFGVNLMEELRRRTVRG